MNITLGDKTHTVSHLRWGSVHPVKASLLIRKEAAESDYDFINGQEIDLDKIDGEYVNIGFLNPESVEVLIWTLKNIKRELAQRNSDGRVRGFLIKAGIEVWKKLKGGHRAK